MVRKLIYLSLLCLTIQAKAQQAKPVRQRLINLVGYLDIRVSKDTLATWVHQVETGESQDAAVSLRNAAWEKFLVSLYRHLGTTPTAAMNEATLRALSQYLTFPFLTGRLLDFREVGQPHINPKKLISISGQGPKHLLLIPELGFDSSLFEDFKEAYADEFTFHEFSFPYGNETWSYPDRANYARADWLTKATQAMVDHLASVSEKELFIAAIGSGMQLAIKVADTSEKVQGIISINGRLQTNLTDPETGEDALPGYRYQATKSSFPTSMVIQVSPGNLTGSYAFTRNLQKNQQYLSQITPAQVNNIFRYNREFSAQDISQTINTLETPVLSIISVHNDQSPKASDLGTIQGWQELISKNPNAPISIVKIPESQDLAFMDQPQLFDIYFRQFIEQADTPVREIQWQNQITIETASPLVTKSQVIETTSINLEYYQTAANDRNIFGELVPYKQVWRAGANKATKLEVTQDVLINDNFLLKKGEYSLFFIPDKDKWQVVFNRIADQWGAFNYKKNFDALRFDVVPEPIQTTVEYLTYDINRVAIDKAEISMEWANTRVAFTIHENFTLPAIPSTLKTAVWKKLLSDAEGDTANPGLTDGKALSYIQRNDTLWFKYDLYAYNNKKAFALNLLIDTDFNQSTGAPWFGQNTSFTFDKALTLWMQKSSGGFSGINGIMKPADFTSGNQNLKYLNNLTYYLDMEEKVYVVGVSISDLEVSGKQIRVIGAVGEFRTWNDDIGDNQAAMINLSK
jgi:hypothetical protein